MWNLNLPLCAALLHEHKLWTEMSCLCPRLIEEVVTEFLQKHSGRILPKFLGFMSKCRSWGKYKIWFADAAGSLVLRLPVCVSRFLWLLLISPSFGADCSSPIFAVIAVGSPGRIRSVWAQRCWLIDWLMWIFVTYQKSLLKGTSCSDLVLLFIDLIGSFHR